MLRPIEPIVIHSENDAWDVLHLVLSGELDPRRVVLSAISFEWAKLQIHAVGPDYHSSLPVSFMRGLTEFHDGFLRSSAIVSRNSKRITSLTNDLKAEMDIVFEVKDGSADLIAFLKEQLEALGPKVLETMDSKHKVILLLGIALIFGGVWSYTKHLEIQVEMQRSADEGSLRRADKDIINRLISLEEQRSKTLSEAVKQVPALRGVIEEGKGSKDAIIRNSQSVESMEIQGNRLTKEDIRDLNKQSRTQATALEHTENLLVVSMTRDEAHYFKVKFRRKNNEEFGGIIRNIPDNEKAIRVLWSSESNRRFVNVRYSARKFENELRDVRVLKVWTPRKRD